MLRRNDRFKSRDLRIAEARAKLADQIVRETHIWGECAARGKTSATYPPGVLPHNCMVVGGHVEPCVCAWCGEPSPVNAEAHR